MASYASTMEMMREMTGISSPARPFGYPVPSHRSWWHRIYFAICCRGGIALAIRNPVSGCFLISFQSSSVSFSALIRMFLSMLIFPMSCSVAASSRSSIFSEERPARCPRALEY